MPQTYSRAGRSSGATVCVTRLAESNSASGAPLPGNSGTRGANHESMRPTLTAPPDTPAVILATPVDVPSTGGDQPPHGRRTDRLTGGRPTDVPWPTAPPVADGRRIGGGRGGGGEEVPGLAVGVVGHRVEGGDPGHRVVAGVGQHVRLAGRIAGGHDRVPVGRDGVGGDEAGGGLLVVLLDPELAGAGAERAVA